MEPNGFADFVECTDRQTANMCVGLPLGVIEQDVLIGYHDNLINR